MIICALCKAPFQTQYDFKLHQHTVHPVPMSETVNRDNIYQLIKQLSQKVEANSAFIRKINRGKKLVI